MAFENIKAEEISTKAIADIVLRLERIKEEFTEFGNIQLQVEESELI